MDIPKNEKMKIFKQIITAMLILGERCRVMFFILFHLHSLVFALGTKKK